MDGESDGEALELLEGELLEEGLKDGELEEDSELEGDKEGELEGDSELDGEREGEFEGDSELEGLSDADGLKDGEFEGDSEDEPHNGYQETLLADEYVPSAVIVYVAAKQTCPGVVWLRRVKCGAYLWATAI